MPGGRAGGVVPQVGGAPVGGAGGSAPRGAPAVGGGGPPTAVGNQVAVGNQLAGHGSGGALSSTPGVGVTRPRDPGRRRLGWRKWRGAGWTELPACRCCCGHRRSRVGWARIQCWREVRPARLKRSGYLEPRPEPHLELTGAWWSRFGGRLRSQSRHRRPGQSRRWSREQVRPDGRDRPRAGRGHRAPAPQLPDRDRGHLGRRPPCGAPVIGEDPPEYHY